MSTPAGVQYTEGLSRVHWGNTKMHVGGYHEYTGDVQCTGGYHEYTRGCSVHRRDTMSTLGGYHEYIGGYHEYTGGIS